MSYLRVDIHQKISNQIIAQIERGAGEFRLPWQQPDGSLVRPINVASGRRYNGVNILALWAAAQEFGFVSGLWGTFRQWAEIGAQVRKGEKATFVVFYRERAAVSDQSDDEEAKQQSRFCAKATPVFAAEQVDNYHPDLPPTRDPVTAIADAERFVAATGAAIIHEGHRAFYSPSTDAICLPPRDAFTGTDTCSPTESFYATIFHELTHWSGHESRCNRQLGQRFGDQAYAIEELVAELGAAFLCADLAVSSAPRADHAAYLANWLQVLKSDKRAIFVAASKASKAVAFLEGLQPSGPANPCPPFSVRPEGFSAVVLSASGRGKIPPAGRSAPPRFCRGH
jgi:antirestriction protein ArdC